MIATDSAPYLSQGERLEFAPIASRPISLDEPECVTISSPPNGFRMPSMEAVRMNDARLSLFASHHEASDESDDDENDDENDTAFIADSVRTYLPTYEEHESLALPSRLNFGQAIREAYSYGYSND